MPAIGKAAAEEAAWAKLQRSAVWWLGEHANAAALEYAGDDEAVKATAAVNAAMQRTTSPGEIIALQVWAYAWLLLNCPVFVDSMTLTMLMLFGTPVIRAALPGNDMKCQPSQTQCLGRYAAKSLL